MYLQAIRALGKIAVGNRSADTLSAVIKALFGLANLKLEEVHFAVGEALADVAQGGIPEAARAALQPSSSSTSATVIAQSPSPAGFSAGATPLPSVAIVRPVAPVVAAGDRMVSDPAFAFEMPTDGAPTPAATPAPTASAESKSAAVAMDVDSSDNAASPTVRALLTRSLSLRYGDVAVLCFRANGRALMRRQLWSISWRKSSPFICPKARWQDRYSVSVCVLLMWIGCSLCRLSY